MKIVVTDSGFGGLGIAAEIYESIKSLFSTEIVEIIFINGLPDEKYGYNSISDKNVKINIFNDLLANINQKLNPDIIVIACNTLSVLFNQTEIYSAIKSKVIDIIEFGTEKVIQYHSTVSNALLAIIGTKTTIDSNVHRNYYQKYQVSFSKLLTIPCTDLVTAIEDDYEGLKVKSIIKNCIKKVELQFLKSNYSTFFLVLACTHFPYVEHIFRHYLNKTNFSYTIINPNSFMIESIKSLLYNRYQMVTDKPGKHSITIISKTIISDQKIRSIASLIQNISEDTVIELQNYRHVPDFFNSEFYKIKDQQ